ncbi:MAG: quinolinate synthase NadA [Desulfurococcaceae archaeon]
MGLVDEILKMKRENKALILAHNYQLPEIQDIADYVGDSLELSIKAMEHDADKIIFCGVDFMAEQALVLAMNKVVLHPEPEAKCPMASMITPEDVRKFRSNYPKAPVVIYVNSPAVVKAEADYIVTSASALKLVSQIDSDTILFGPDRNLADYLSKTTGKTVIPVPPNSYCPVHEAIKANNIIDAKTRDREAKVLVHPECIREVRDLADFIGSTSQMIKYVRETNYKSYIIATEIGILHRMRKENPDKKLIPANPEAVCIDMKKIDLNKLYRSLKEGKYVVEVPDKIRRRVLRVLENSFEIIGVEIPWRKK